MNVEMMGFWEITPLSLVGRCHHFRGPSSLKVEALPASCWYCIPQFVASLKTVMRLITTRLNTE
jgi:hypothetical protein